MWGIIIECAHKTGWKPIGTFKMDENDKDGFLIMQDPKLELCKSENENKKDYSSHQGQYYE